MPGEYVCGGCGYSMCYLNHCHGEAEGMRETKKNMSTNRQ